MQSAAVVLTRSRIFTEMDRCLTYPLLVVCAPMGYGKTTVVKQYFEGTEDVDCAWTVIPESGSLVYFWERLSWQLSRLDHMLGARLKQLGFPTEPAAAAQVVDVLSDASFERPLFVVIDDYQNAPDLALDSLLKLLLQEELHNLHFIVVTRDTSKLSMLEYREKQLGHLLGRDRLFFTRQEVAEYCSLSSFGFKPEVTDAIYQVTQGWASMVYLLALGAQQGLSISTLTSHNTASIDGLIEKYLFEPLDDESKRVLLGLSVLNDFSMPLAVYMFDSPGVVDTINRLMSVSTFVTFNELTGAFAIHQILLNFLRSKAEYLQPQQKHLRSRVGSYLLEQGDMNSAFVYFYLAGETERILSVLNRIEVADVHFTRFRLIHQTFAEIDEALCIKYPLAFLRYVRIFSLLESEGERLRGKRVLRLLEDEFARQPEDGEYRNRILGEIQVVWTFYVFNDLKAMVEHNARAVEYFAGGTSCIVTRDKEVTFGSPHLVYTYYAEAGSLLTTAEYIGTAFDTLVAASGGCGFGGDTVAKAEYLLETGDFAHVRQAAEKAIHKATMGRQPSLVICAKFTLARYLLWDGEFQQALDLLEGLREEIGSENNPLLLTAVDMCKAYIECCLGRLDSIPPWVRYDETASAHFVFNGVAFNFLVIGKAILLSGDYPRLSAHCERSQPEFDTYGNLLGTLHNQILKAIAEFHVTDSDEWKDYLLQAISTGAADGIVMPFIEYADHLLPLLERLPESDTDAPDFLRRLIPQCRQYAQTLSENLTRRISLSARESEILRLLDQGKKHQEIAKELFISVPTVRFHVRNIYNKFGTNNKLLALHEAHALHLL